MDPDRRQLDFGLTAALLGVSGSPQLLAQIHQ